MESLAHSGVCVDEVFPGASGRVEGPLCHEGEGSSGGTDQARVRHVGKGFLCDS